MLQVFGRTLAESTDKGSRRVAHLVVTSGAKELEREEAQPLRGDGAEELRRGGGRLRVEDDVHLLQADGRLEDALEAVDEEVVQ